MLHLGVISLLPEIFESLKYGVVGRALEQDLAKVDYWNPRDYASGTYRRVDDKPYGGGPGMIMLYEPLNQAIHDALNTLPSSCQVIYLSPQGEAIGQNKLNRLVKNNQSLLFIAGRYEGIDERIIERHVDEEWSVGDFVLSGGEFAAMVFIDAMIRLLPGSLGHEESAIHDSFMNGLLDYPHYTRPEEVDGMCVPSVLLSGHHANIHHWRRKQSLGKTWLKQPRLLENIKLSDSDKQLLREFKNEVAKLGVIHD